MKILQVIQRPQLRGAEIFACQLSMELTQMGSQVDVVYLFSQENMLRFDLRFIPLNASTGKRFWDFGAYRRLNRIIRQGQYDVVQSNAGDTLKYAAISKMLFRWKTPLIYRNANKISDFLTNPLKILLNKYFVSQVDHVISVSRLCREDFAGIFSFPPNAIDTIEIGINMHASPPFPEDLSEIRANGPLLLSVGSFVPEKNQLGLLDIFNGVLKSIPNARLVLIGKGKLEAVVSARIAELGLGGRVYMIGHRTDVHSIMKGAQVFLLPSLIEGLPAVVLEAQFNRVAVVAYDVGGIPEVVKQGETGWLIEKGDEQRFSQAIVECLTNSEQRNRVVQMAYHQVVKKFDNKLVAERFYELYCKIAPRYK